MVWWAPRRFSKRRCTGRRLPRYASQANFTIEQENPARRSFHKRTRRTKSWKNSSFLERVGANFALSALRLL
jgi:hypothetical protein